MDLLLHTDDQTVDIHTAQRVQAGCRFVVKDDLRVQGDGPGQADTLLHATGQVVGHHVFNAFQADEAQLFLDDALNRRFIVFRMLAQAKGDVLADGHGIEEGRILKDHAHVAAHGCQLFFIEGGNVFIMKEDLPFRRLLQPDDQAQDRTLARAAGTEDGQRFALMDV